MFMRILPAVALATLVPVLPAQADGAANPKSETQEPQQEQPKGQSPGDRITELQRELDRLKQEVAFVRERVADSSNLLRRTFHDRELDLRAIDAGTSNMVTSLAPAPSRPNQPAQVLTADEIAELGDGVLMVVEGSPVPEAEYSALMDYLASLPAAGQEQARAQRAIYELIRIHSLRGNFQDGVDEATQKAQAAAKELAEGQAFDEVRKRYGEVRPNEDGNVEITHFSPYGLFVEHAAFSTEPGHVTEPVHGLTGLTLLAVHAVSKGETPQADVVRASIIQIPYNESRSEIDQVRTRAATGQIEVKVRSAEMLPNLPAPLRPMTAQPTDKASKLAPAVVDPNKEVQEDAKDTKGQDQPNRDG